MLSLLFLLSCQKSVVIDIDGSRKYINKNLNDKLIIKLFTNKNKPLNVSLLLHNLTDDVSDMPIYKKKLVIKPKSNCYIIDLKDIGVGKYSLRLYYQNKLIDYRIIDVSQ